ncbi:MAG: hypothetical protein COA78_22020 [Blastopirellula sp.]|nr:MAG: hypothetical protein COA78_22020 [Blastopirellula sp.]
MTDKKLTKILIDVHHMLKGYRSQMSNYDIADDIQDVIDYFPDIHLAIKDKDREIAILREQMSKMVYRDNNDFLKDMTSSFEQCIKDDEERRKTMTEDEIKQESIEFLKMVGILNTSNSN